MLQLLLNALMAKFDVHFVALRTGVRYDLLQMEKRLMAQIDDLKAAEDRVGTDIATAVAQNKEHLDKIAELIAKLGFPTAPDLQAAIDAATAHAEALEAAFPKASSGATDPAPNPVPKDDLDAAAT